MRFREAFSEILDARFYPISWLDGEVAAGRMILLCQEDSAILFSLRTYPSGLRELHGECATGKREVIAEALIPEALEFARQVGCEFATISSRAGWEKIMRSSGFKLHQTIIRKAL